ncbi:U3 small nucleolar RNA-associated protein, putative [Phytophthora infestans T30-4]|uniref:U3 small nucleolar RNA-associated protein, putative n=1 Tax=Phytophthora infestans (strain T30-4) TaxID=403677 RepID=D0N5E0_PHYIT|nr:U3 small nucleolar RNA-associated protein, putative [Phytophthora infestans T30-4]EEY70098.1 U3 small nucleolar RNA-associated protein, putative [Phytophthora infestans T30-4]|eukprot:XP_002998745.1 U3 small nucleolar RNA-associated protein, putative [Phytophthora infestans T30-4]
MTPKTTKKRKASDVIPGDASATATTLQVHRCRFVDWMPSAAHALCFNAAGDQLAVARATGDVEIWSVTNKWHLKFVLPGSAQSQVSALCWAPDSDRLFASSLDGTLWELDLHSLCRKNVTDSNGGPIWSMVMDAETQQLALYFSKGFLTTGGRVVSLAWHSQAHKIFSGSENGIIHCWNAATGRNESRITLETLTKQKSVVWSLVVLDDLTLVSGDSAGNLSFWNAPTGTLLQKFSHLTADVLAICVSQSNNTLFASGVDNQVVEFRRSVAESGNATWAYSYSHRGHSHDVRALALSANVKPVLVSGGIDTQLVWYRGNSFGASRPSKIASMPYRQSIALANEKRVLMVQKSTCLDLWRLATQSATTGAITKKHKLLLELNVGNALNLSCSAVAPNASFVACSNSKELKLFELDTEQSFQPKKVTTLPRSVKGPARVLAFSPDSTRLVIASASYQIRVLDLAKMESASVPSPLVSLTISSDGQWLATGDASNNIAVYNLDSMQFYCQLPRPSEMHTSMSFNPSGKTLVVTLVSNSFVCYDVETKGLSEWYRQNHEQFPKELVEGRNLKGMAFDPANPDFLYLYSQVSLYQINMGKQASAKSPPKKTRRRAMSVCTESDSKNDAAEGELVELEDGFCHNELIIVETPWLKVLSRLPGALHRHKYGK